MELLSVPFSRLFWNDSYDAQITLRGLVRTEPDGLVVEFRRSENRWGLGPSSEDQIRTVVIPWDEVQSLQYRQWWIFHASLLLQTRTLRALEGVPKAQGNEVSLPIARRDRLAARDLAATVEMALADRRLAALEAPSSPRALPPY